MDQGNDHAALFDIGMPTLAFVVPESIDVSRRDSAAYHIRFGSSGIPHNAQFS